MQYIVVELMAVVTRSVQTGGACPFAQRQERPPPRALVLRTFDKDGDAEAAARRLRDAGATVVTLAAECADRTAARGRATAAGGAGGGAGGSGGAPGGSGSGGGGGGGGGERKRDLELELVAAVDRWLEQLQSSGSPSL